MNKFCVFLFALCSCPLLGSCSSENQRDHVVASGDRKFCCEDKLGDDKRLWVNLENFGSVPKKSVMGQTASLETKDSQESKSENRKEFIPSPVAVDEEGYVTSFSLDEPDKATEFFKRYGFVVIRDVITDEEADLTVDEIWYEVIELSKEISGRKGRGAYTVDRYNTNTWEEGWPCGSAGILGYDIASGPRAFYNRMLPKVYRAFACTIGTPKLLVSLDRYGIMRPTRDITFTDAEGKEVVQDKPNWRTVENWFHWDLNPWHVCGIGLDKPPEDEEDGMMMGGKKVKEADDPRAWRDDARASVMFITENNSKYEFGPYEKVQGLLVLANSKENDGGFITVPGYHNFLKDWATQTPLYSTAGFVSIKKEDPLISHAQKITARKGSVIIWSSRMPHCNFPNDGPNFRYCQYLKMFPAEVISTREVKAARADAIRFRFPKLDIGIPPLGQKLFGFEEWEDDSQSP